MQVPINEAKGQLSALIKAANDGEEVLLTSHGKVVAEIKSCVRKKPIEKLAVARRIRSKAVAKATTGPAAAEADAFLYDDSGMPS